MRIAWFLTISLLGHLVTQSQAECDDLRQEITSIKAAFHQKTEETSNQLLIIREQMSRLAKENQEKNEELAALRKTINDLSVATRNHYAQTGNADEIRKRTSTTTVAFHACFSHDVNYLGRSQNLNFDRVITDTNSAYSRSGGTYTLPRTGIYVITWVTPVVGNIPLELLVNGVHRGRTDPSSTGNGASQSTTGIAVLSLYQNDHLSIRTHQSASPVGQLVSNTWQDACFSLWSI